MSVATNSLIEVTIECPDDFLKIRETLTRIGIASRRDRILYQSCHILHKKDRESSCSRYYLVHFKELFKLDGKPTNFTEEDIARRNTIANILHEWKLFKLVDISKSSAPILPISAIQILPFKEKLDWRLESKYTIGTKNYSKS